MKTTKSMFVLFTAALLGLLLAGCDPDDNAVSGFLYDQTGGEYVLTDQYGNTQTFSEEQLEQLAAMPREQAAAFVTGQFRKAFPADYANPATVAEAAVTSGQESQVVVSETARTAVNALGFIPGYGQIASVVANGLLGIGALWFGRKKQLAERVNESLVKGIDTFRDVLDQTPQGERIDTRLKEILKGHQQSLGTAREVGRLLDRYATPTKQAIKLEAEPLASAA